LHLVGTGILLAAPDGGGRFVVQALNHRAAELLHIGPDVADTPLQEALPGVLGTRLVDGLRACRTAGREQELEAKMDAGESVRWLRFVLAPQHDEQEHLQQIVVTVSDVTRQKQAESQTLASELRFRNLVEGSIQGVVVLRQERAVFCNAAFTEIFGFAGPVEVYRLPSLTALVHEDDLPQMLDNFAEVEAGKQPAQRRVVRAVRRDGGAIWIETFASVVLWDDAPALQIALHDVTERVRAELALQESEARYRTLVESSLQGIVVSVRGEPVFANHAAAQMGGYEDGDAFLASARGEQFPLVKPEERERVLALAQDLMSGTLDVVETDVTLRRIDGSTAFTHAQARRVPWQGGTAMMTTLIDLTERRRAEAALEESEARYRTLVESAPIGITVHVDGRGVFCNEVMARMLGYEKPEDYVTAAAREEPLGHVPDAARQLALETFLRLQSGELDADWNEIELTRQIGGPVPVRTNGRRILWNGRPAVLTAVLDLTEQKRLEAEVRESRNLLQSVFNALPLWVLVKDRDERFLMANRQMLDDYGIDPEALPGLSTHNAPWLEEASRARIIEADQRTMETGERVEVPDADTTLPDGRRLTVQSIRVPLRAEDGSVTGLVQVGQDVTRYKQAEAALAASEMRYRTLVELSLEGITVHQGGRPVLVNDTYVRLLGYADVDAYLRANAGKVLPHVAPEFREEALRRSEAVESGEMNRYAWERPTVRLDGEPRELYVQSRRIDWDGAPAVLTTFLDITERKQAEATLRASEERYRLLVEGSVQGVAVFSLQDFRALFVNDAMLALVGGQSVQDYLSSVHMLDNVREPHLSKLRAELERMATAEIERFEDELLAYRRGQEPYWSAFMARRVTWDGEPAVQITAMDISDRKRAEEALKDRQAVLTKENEYFRQDLSRRRGRQDQAIIAESQAMLRVLHEADLVARSRVPVLIEGATGTGKEVVAEFIHRHSDRAAHLLSVVNCGALSETLMDAELFGHERGAFTGATEARAGLIEIADGGTLFLDEIGDLPPSAQVRLLRVLERGVVRRVGSTRERKVDVRVLAATHRTLKEQVQAGTFREDLYHRLLVIRIEVPRLRERIEDILPLANRFCALACQEAHLEPMAFSEEARLALTRHDWPGNVRELAHTVQRAVFAAQLEGVAELRPEHFDLHHAGPSELLLPIKEVTHRAEQQHVRAVLRHFGGNRRQAAETLGISERHLYRLLG